MSPKSRKSDKNFWTYLCSTSKSNFRFAIGSDRILTSFWFRAHKSNIDLVMENTLFIIGNLADMCSGKVAWKYETIFDTNLMWQAATCTYLNCLHQKSWYIKEEIPHEEGLAQTAWAQHFPNSSISPNSTKIYKRGEKILCDSFDNYAHEIGGCALGGKRTEHATVTYKYRYRTPITFLYYSSALCIQ